MLIVQIQVHYYIILLDYTHSITWIATFLFDLLTKEEEESDKKVEKIQNQVPGLTLNKFNILLLADRLIKATNYILQVPELKKKEKELNLGYFGASTGIAAALYASRKISETTAIKTIVSRGGRPDLISSISNCDKKIIETIKNIPLLFIIGQKDKLVLDWTKNFIKNNKLVSNSKFEIIKDASHLFEEEGTLEKAGDIATRWFILHL
jgi:putative phosphoribosyl transferase